MNQGSGVSGQGSGREDSTSVPCPVSPAPLLSVRNLSVSFHGEKQDFAAVKNISFAIKPGEMLALVGESGSGKSVTALSILQLLPHPAAFYPSGSIRFTPPSQPSPARGEGEELMGANENLLRTIRGNKIAMIFQEPMTALNPLHTIGKQIAEQIMLHKPLGKKQVEVRVLELLEEVGLLSLVASQRSLADNKSANDLQFTTHDSLLSRYPHQLSGGQRQRVMIAMALANNPSLLIADEPTTALDVTLQMQILGLLKQLQRERGMAILLITHDLPLVQRMADRVAVMKDGEIVDIGTVEEIFRSEERETRGEERGARNEENLDRSLPLAPRAYHPYTRHLLTSEPRGTASPLAPRSSFLLACENVKVHFAQKRGIFGGARTYTQAVDGVSLAVKSGETVGIVGESGSGKSTLALALLRLIPSQGSIVYLGQKLETLSRKQINPLRKELQIVFQDPFGSLNPRMTIGDIIGEGLAIHFPELSQEERDSHIAEMLKEVGLPSLVDSRQSLAHNKNANDSRLTTHDSLLSRYPHEFSGGQRQRISIARAMVLRPKLVVLDEPTSALDVSVQSQVIDLLRTLQMQHGLSYLFISHDLRVIRALAHRIIVMKDGKIVEEGMTQQMLEAPRHPYTQTLIRAAMLG